MRINWIFFFRVSQYLKIAQQTKLIKEDKVKMFQIFLCVELPVHIVNKQKFDSDSNRHL